MTSLFAIGGQPIMLAHQGGWDEILLIGGPIAIIAWLLMLAKKRVDAADYQAEHPEDHQATHRDDGSSEHADEQPDERSG